jgi:hypothetical protein
MNDILKERCATAREKMTDLGTNIEIPNVSSGAIHATAVRMF